MLALKFSKKAALQMFFQHRLILTVFDTVKLHRGRSPCCFFFFSFLFWTCRKSVESVFFLWKIQQKLFSSFSKTAKYDQWCWGRRVTDEKLTSHFSYCGRIKDVNAQCLKVFAHQSLRTSLICAILPASYPNLKNVGRSQQSFVVRGFLQLPVHRHDVFFL